MQIGAELHRRPVAKLLLLGKAGGVRKRDDVHPLFVIHKNGCAAVAAMTEASLGEQSARLCIAAVYVNVADAARFGEVGGVILAGKGKGALAYKRRVSAKEGKGKFLHILKAGEDARVPRNAAETACARVTAHILPRPRGESAKYAVLRIASCLGNSMDRGAWQAPVYGVTKNWT